jgi:hypothetical protein
MPDMIERIEVFGSPDDQELGEQYDAYQALMTASAVLPISEPPENGRRGLLSLRTTIIGLHEEPKLVRRGP